MATANDTNKVPTHLIPLGPTTPPILAAGGHALNALQRVEVGGENQLGRLGGDFLSLFKSPKRAGPATSGAPPAGPPPPPSMADMLTALGGQLGLDPTSIKSLQQQMVQANIKKPAGMSDADWKTLQPLLSQALAGKQQTDAQEASQLAKQAFYQTTILPYLNQQQRQAGGELQSIFADEKSNLANIPAGARAQYAQLNDQNQAGALAYMQGLQQQALAQPQMDQYNTLLQQLLAQSQATQKTLAQQGAISGAQALQQQVPGAAVSFTQ